MLLIKVDAAEAIISIQLTEACSTNEVMGNLLKDWGLVVLSNNGLVQVFGSRQGREPLGF